MKIIVKAHPQTGLVLTANTNKEGWSTVRVEQSTPTMSGRIVNLNNRVAFITGKTADLEKLGLSANSEFPIPGKLVVKEATTPFYEGQKAKLVPGTEVVCSVGGQPIYRQTEFSSDVNEADVLVQHDNVEQIKAAQLQTAGGGAFEG